MWPDVESSCTPRLRRKNPHQDGSVRGARRSCAPRHAEWRGGGGAPRSTCASVKNGAGTAPTMPQRRVGETKPGARWSFHQELETGLLSRELQDARGPRPVAPREAHSTRARAWLDMTGPRTHHPCFWCVLRRQKQGENPPSGMFTKESIGLG